MPATLLIEKRYGLQGMEMDNGAITSLLAQRDKIVFEKVFKSHFKQLHAYAFTILRDESDAEEMVQQVFFRIWERDETLSYSGSVTAYLYRAVHNECLNFIKHRKVKSIHQQHVSYTMKNEVEHPARKQFAGELQQKIHAALEELPEQCRTVFQMSRFDELKYREIAEKLGISVKTVENHMGKALKKLRLKLADFLIFFLLFFNF